MTPAERATYQRRYWATHPEYRAIRTQMQRVYRARKTRLLRKAEAFDRAWASLHDLSCRYPDAGCSCRAVLLTLPLRSVA